MALLSMRSASHVFDLGLAFFVGAAIVWVPSLVGARLFFTEASLQASAILRRFYAAQLLKWILSIVLFSLVFGCSALKPYAVFLGFMVAQILVVVIVNKTNKTPQSLKSSLLG